MDTTLYFLVLVLLICSSLIIKQHYNIYQKYKFIVYGILIFLIFVFGMYLYVNYHKRSNKK